MSLSTTFPDTDLRLCPTCNMKLFKVALPRKIRFHDLRHYADLRVMPRPAHRVCVPAEEKEMHTA